MDYSKIYWLACDVVEDGYSVFELNGSLEDYEKFVSDFPSIAGVSNPFTAAPHDTIEQEFKFYSDDKLDDLINEVNGHQITSFPDAPEYSSVDLLQTCPKSEPENLMELLQQGKLYSSLHYVVRDILEDKYDISDVGMLISGTKLETQEDIDAWIE